MEFLKANAGKISVIVVLLSVGGFLFARQMGNTKITRGLPDQIEFVCVETGKHFTFKKTRDPIVLPRDNPETGQATLVPVYEKDGDYFVPDRRRNVITRLGERNKFVDARTLKVRESAGG